MFSETPKLEIKIPLKYRTLITKSTHVHSRSVRICMPLTDKYFVFQNCYILKEEHDYKVFSSTQCTRDVQAVVAKALGINASR